MLDKANSAHARTTKIGVYIKLLEYNNMNDMILLSELSRRRIRNMQKIVRIGNNVVIRVDKLKRKVHLSV